MPRVDPRRVELAATAALAADDPLGRSFEPKHLDAVVASVRHEHFAAAATTAKADGDPIGISPIKAARS